MSTSITLSPLAHTWIFDIDGTVVAHNGYKLGKEEIPLPGVVNFFNTIPEQDMIIFLTARGKHYAQATEDVLIKHGIRFDYIIYEVPSGERVLVNDKKPSGLACSFAINLTRDQFDMPSLQIDSSL